MAEPKGEAEKVLVPAHSFIHPLRNSATVRTHHPVPGPLLRTGGTESTHWAHAVV